MTTATLPVIDEITSKGFELSRRWGLAILDDPSLLDGIPDGVQLVLLPDDDRNLTEAKIAIGIDAVRRGENVYFRHLRLSDLPDE